MFDHNITAAVPSRIEEIAARLAAIKDEYTDLDGAHGKLFNLDLPGGDPGRTAMVYLDREMGRLDREVIILEEALSICQPRTLREILIMLAVAFYRLETLPEYDGDDTEAIRAQLKRDTAIISSTLDSVIPTLEKLAGVAVQELGLETYWNCERDTAELLAAAAKIEAEHAKATA